MKHSKLYTILFMMTLSVLFGAGIAGLSIVSQPVIERNNRLLTQRAYVEVFGLGDVGKLSSDEVAALIDSRVEVGDTPIVDPETGTEFTILKAYDESRRVTAVAFNFRGLGFWAPIKGWLAVTPDRSRTVGLVITEQKETPGLGGRVEEPIFTDPFKASVLVKAPGDEGGKYIIISSSKPSAGTEKAERHVEAITGATQTCMAMDTILNDALRAFNRAWNADTARAAN
ncbi:MAG: FMN-binding protein [Lentisphaeria bacterium]|nr:FMN-binding protein [Lentisphaeria bacterium]